MTRFPLINTMHHIALKSSMIALRRLVGVSVMVAAHAGGQTLDPVRVGARVSIGVTDSACKHRFRSCQQSAVVGGTLTRVTADTLVLQFGPSATLAVPRVRGQQLFVSQGRSRIRSALSAALLTGLVTYTIANLTHAAERSTVRWAAAMAGGGLVFGALLPAERWQRVRAP